MEIERLDVFLDYLASVHRRTRRVVELIPAADLEWAPAPGKFTFGDIVRHLAGIERWMYAETVSGRPSRYPGHGRELAMDAPGALGAGGTPRDALLAYYDRLHEESRALFAALDAAALRGRSVTPAGSEITTWKWLRAMLEHEAHHRGQLYLMLALRGIPTPPIYGLTAEQLEALSVVRP